MRLTKNFKLYFFNRVHKYFRPLKILRLFVVVNVVVEISLLSFIIYNQE